MGAKRLHITSGSAAVPAVMAAAGCGEEDLLIHHDILSVGRLAPLGDLPTWHRERLANWTEDMPADAEFPHDLIEEGQALRDAEAVTLWLGSALSDQLVLAFTVQLCEQVGADPAKLSLRQEAVVGIGMLEPDELASVDEAPPEALDAEELALVRRAWAAATAAEPDALLAFMDEAPAPLPFLHAAMAMFLERYPAEKSGLPVWDETLLAATAHEAHSDESSEAASARAILRRALGERRLAHNPVGDTHLLQRMRRLGDTRLAQPLLVLSGDKHDRATLQARFTPAGKDVAEGRASFLGLNAADSAPADEWIGGVLLSPSQDRLWYRRGATLVRARRSG